MRTAHSTSSPTHDPGVPTPQPEPAALPRTQFTGEETTEGALFDAMLDPAPLNRVRLNTVTHLLGLACLRAADAELGDTHTARPEGITTGGTSPKLELGLSGAMAPEAPEPKAPLASGQVAAPILFEFDESKLQGHATASTAMILDKIQEGETR